MTEQPPEPSVLQHALTFLGIMLVTRPALFTEIACKDVDPNQFVSVFHLVAEITRRTGILCSVRDSAMSAVGTKRTFWSRRSITAFGGKPDINI